MTPMLSLDDVTLSTRDAIFPLTVEKGKIVKTFNGSAALHQVATALELNKGDVVLLPAYCCGAEIWPFLHEGCRCEFFDVDNNLNADISTIEMMLREHRNVKAIMITHYFGFPQGNLAQVLELCEKHAIALIEDCAHAFFSSDGDTALGSVGQFAIFSPRKSLPLTEGGLMVMNHAVLGSAEKELQAPALLPRWQRLVYSLQQNTRSGGVRKISWSVLFRLTFMMVLSIPAIGIKILKKLPIVKSSIWLSADVEGEDAIPIYSVGMSARAESIMRNANSEQIIEARRRNYILWLDELARIASTSDCKSEWKVAPLMPELSAGCCPLYFPVLVRNPAFVKEYMAEQDIECFNWWQHRHEAVDWSQFPVAENLKCRVVALPVHQKMNVETIQRAAKHLEQALVISRNSGIEC